MKPWTLLGLVAAAVALWWYVTQANSNAASSQTSTDSSGSGTFMTGTSLVDQMFQAISRQENVATFHNNPAALTAAAADQVGANYTTNTTGGVVVNFATLQEGIDAGKAFVQQFVDRHSGLTLIQALSTYINGPNAASTIQGAKTGDYPASVANYAAGVANAIGASVNDTLASIFGGGQ